MPVSIEKRDGKYCVVGPNGKLEGACHASKKDAVAQVQAINISKGTELIAAERIKVMSEELNLDQGIATEHAPITVMSDGTPEGTVLLINGVPLEFDSMDIYCFKEGDHPSCSISVTVRDTDENGIVVSRTMTLRKEESEHTL